jgi:2-polyprenyl-3-methyl-5-hydroxy-6-metoxy-1,4-benzoquinol methylase
MSPSSYHESVWEGVPEGSDPSQFELRRSFLLEHAKLVRAETPTRVLDVGCGDGRFAAELQRAGFSVVGIDVAEEPLRRARATHPELDVQVVPVDGPWPLADASVDVVWAGETIEHVVDTAAWLSEVRRVLRSGGSLLLSTPAHGRVQMLALALSARRFDAHFDPRADHLRFYSSRTLTHLLQDFGFEQIDVRAAGGPGAQRVLLAAAVRSRF